jgi:hypothetical protein
MGSSLAGGEPISASNRRSPDLQGVPNALQDGPREPGSICGPAKKLRPHRLVAPVLGAVTGAHT